MREFLEQYALLLYGKERQLIGLGFIFVITVVLELAGISLIGPFLAAAANPNFLQHNTIALRAQQLLGIQDVRTLLLLVGLGIVLLFISKSVVAYFVYRRVFRFAFSHQAELRTRLMRRFQTMPYEEFAERNTAAFTNILNNHTTLYAFKTLVPSLRMAAEAIFLTGLLLFLAFVNWMLLIVLSLTIGMTAFVFQRTVRNKLRVAGRDQLVAAEGFVKALNQGMAAYKEISVIGKQEFFLDRLSESAKHYGLAASQSMSIQVLPKYLVESAMAAFVVGTVAFVLVTDADHTASLSALAVFGFAAIRSMSSVSTLLHGANELRISRHAMLDLCTELAGLKGTKLPRRVYKRDHRLLGDNAEPSFQRVDLDRVSYRHPGAKNDSVSAITLSILQGQSVGLIGGSGSGKTTLVDLVLGLLRPTAGEIRVDGVPLDELTETWSRVVGYIPQGHFLLDDTIRRNVAFGERDDEIDEQLVRDAVRSAQLDDVVATQASGLDTVVGERGVRLSGGQAQRIALARMFYHQRTLIVLDEATAALDSATEREIVRAIDSLKGTKTLIIIAHRLSTLSGCDVVYRLDNGQLVGHGRVDENGDFREMPGLSWLPTQATR